MSIIKTLKQKALQGVFWSLIERFSVQGVQFILSILIARLISPLDYGLVAMISVFMVIAQTLIDSGFSNALIQRKNRNESDFSTVFYFNILISIIVYCLLYISAKYIAVFYAEPKLIIVTRWVGLNLIVSSFSIIQITKLTIALDFKRMAKLTLSSVIVSGAVGVYLAYSNYGVWALVVQSLLNNLMNAILLWLTAKWTPLLQFSWVSFKRLSYFGSKLLFAGLLHNLYGSLYNMIIGIKFQAADLGYFNRASTIAMFPSGNLSLIVGRVIYPIQCDIQDDNGKVRESFLRNLSMQAYIIFPLMVGLSILSQPLVILLLTDKWLPSANLIAILSLAYMWYPIMQVNYDILNVKGRSDYALKAEILKKLTGVSILFFTLHFGLETVCWGLLAYSFFDLIIIIYFVGKVMDVSYRDEFITVLPIIGIVLIMGIVIYLSLCLFQGALNQLIFGSFAGIFTYLTVSFLFGLKEFSLLRSFFIK